MDIESIRRVHQDAVDVLADLTNPPWVRQVCEALAISTRQALDLYDPPPLSRRIIEEGKSIPVRMPT